MSDDEWEIVDNPQRKKREARKERRAIREAAEAAEEAAEHYRQLELEAEAYSRELSASDGSSTSRGVVGATSAPKPVVTEPEFTRVGPQTQSTRRAAKNARKGKSKGPKPAKLPQNEDALVEFIQKLLVVESRALTIAELGARIQASTRNSWNKAFKSEYGPMDKFLRSYSNIFHVTKGGEVQVSLKSREVKTDSTKRRQRAPKSDSSPGPRSIESRASKQRVSFADPPDNDDAASPKKASATDKQFPAVSESKSDSSSNGKDSKTSKKSKRKRKVKGGEKEMQSGYSPSYCKLLFLFLVLMGIFAAAVLFNEEFRKLVTKPV